MKLSKPKTPSPRRFRAMETWVPTKPAMPMMRTTRLESVRSVTRKARPESMKPVMRIVRVEARRRREKEKEAETRERKK